MMFFEKLKEVVYTYKSNLIITGVLFLLTLVGNISVYYIFINKININDSISSNELVYLENKQEIEEKIETNEDLHYKVDIKGAVNKEGVYELKEKSRVIDAIKMAGGLKENADTSVINLSKYIKDEMVIVVYTKDEVDKFKEVKQEEIKKEEQCIIYNEIITNDSCKDNEIDNKNEIELDVKISINTADLELLMTLPGIGESKAKSIIEYREQTPFNSIEDIMNVSGIGEKAFEQIKDYITV